MIGTLMEGRIGREFGKARQRYPRRWDDSGCDAARTRARPGGPAGVLRSRSL